MSSIFGRYECIDPENNHKKFWWIVLHQSKQKVLATWGRIGHQSPSPKEYTIEEAQRKVREKLKKGYVKVEGYTEKVGNQSVHFIKEFCGG